MKPIFSTEQARYQKFASFFIVALGCFARLRESMRDAQTFGDQGSAFGNRQPFEKGWANTFKSFALTGGVSRKRKRA